MLVEWTDSISTLDENIDSQHQYILKLLNLLEEENIRKKRNPKAVLTILKKMLQFLELHFKYEGIFMKSIGYPNQDAIDQDHAHFIQQVNSMIADFSDAEFVDSRVINMLQHGLFNHIRNEHDFSRYKAKVKEKKKKWWW